MLVFREIRPKSEEVKAKKRKLPDARGARAMRLCLRLAAVAFSIRGASDRCRITAKVGRTDKDGEGTEKNK